jgi:hypothetical protein
MPRQLTEPITLEGAPALSPTGKLFVLFGYAWVVVGPVVLYFVQRVFNLRVQEESPLVEAGALVLVLGFVLGPLGIAYFPRRFGRLRSFRWLLATPQPGARLDHDGLELCTPEDGCRRFLWDEIGSLEPDPAWLRGSLVEGWPTVDLKAPDGRALFRVRGSVYGQLDPVGGRWHSGPRTLAEHVVVIRPDRFGFLEPTQLPPHYWFRLREDARPRHGL